MPSHKLDHTVLYAEDVDRMCDFYETIDGIETGSFGGGRRYIQLGDEKINLREVTESELVAAEPTAGAGDFCIVTDTPLDDVRQSLIERGIEIVEGPVPRRGADRPLTSIYIHDPEGNLVEIANYREPEAEN